MIDKLYKQSNSLALEQSALLRSEGLTQAEMYSRHDILKHKYPFVGTVQCSVDKGIDFEMLHMNDDVVAWQYFWLGSYEQQLMKEYIDLCSNAKRILDIGAYTGCYAVVGALLGCTVDAFEMIPRTCERLKINSILNGVTKSVNIHNFGASNESVSRTALLPRHEDFLGTGNSLDVKDGIDMVSAVPCRVVRIDEWWEEAGKPNIDLLKVDVEEHELEVLEGMSNMLAQCRPSMVIEIANDKKAEALAVLCNLGYKVDNIRGMNYVAKCASSKKPLAA